MDYLICYIEPTAKDIETVFYSANKLLELLSSWFSTEFNTLDDALDYLESVNPDDYWFESLVVVDINTTHKWIMGSY